MANTSGFTELLRNRNLKATSMRLEVLGILSDNDKAISQSEIQGALKDFDRVTLYRTLNTLMENGVIHVALRDEQNTYYAMCSHQCDSHSHNHKHVHFRCNKCEKVTCVQTSNDLSISIPGYEIDDFEIEATGLCKSCA